MSNQGSSQLITVGISMPKDFSQEPYEAIHKHCQPRMTPEPPMGERWDEYAAAWNAIAYRFRAVADYDEAFVAALFPDSSENRYKQERELFGFFVSGLSALESFSYGLYFLASLIAPQHFLIQNRQGITLTSTARCFHNTFPIEPITSRLQILLDDVHYSKWKKVRNVLAHRCAPGRIISLGGPQLQDDLWKLDNIALNPDTTGNRRKWLADTLKYLLDEAWLFIEKSI